MCVCLSSAPRAHQRNLRRNRSIDCVEHFANCRRVLGANLCRTCDSIPVILFQPGSELAGRPATTYVFANFAFRRETANPTVPSHSKVRVFDLRPVCSAYSSCVRSTVSADLQSKALVPQPAICSLLSTSRSAMIKFKVTKSTIDERI